MTTSELGAVEALLVKVLPDPMGFAERVLGELAERLATVPPGDGPNVVPGYESAAHEALVDRNLLLAAALVACDCWGEHAGCPGCGGEGSTGWLPPDPELYAEYVAPAVRRTTSGRPPAATSAAEPAVPAHRADPAGTAGMSLSDDAPGEGEAR
ncbi:hypothetical protein GCM10023176_62440 [Micromonospora coerulea]|uniref:Uncharacterized protein n=1 Tax=Micromonospora coerulea TaxID=47856 RepID=A0ABP8T7B1_9ACTN